MKTIRNFSINGRNYRKLENIVGGSQWECQYPNCESARAAVWYPNPTRQQIIDAIEEVNLAAMK